MISSGLATDVPVTIDRDAARNAARDELSKQVYEEAQPPLPVRILEWVAERVRDALDRINDATPGGWWGLLVLTALLAAAAFAISRGVGPVRSQTRAEAPMFGVHGRRRSADHRADADAARARGDWAAAVRERFRAIVRGLEEHGLIESRPGSTADEAAEEAGGRLPVMQPALRNGARIFDEIVYGDRPAAQLHDDELRALDERLRGARATVAVS